MILLLIWCQENLRFYIDREIENSRMFICNIGEIKINLNIRMGICIIWVKKCLGIKYLNRYFED